MFAALHECWLRAVFQNAFRGPFPKFLPSGKALIFCVLIFVNARFDSSPGLAKTIALLRVFPHNFTHDD